MNVRVRYAPSPTGAPHVGNIRTALFDWLFARHTGGKFIVRIEDTDVERREEGAVEAILEGLRWLELDWDEGPEVGGDYGPYFQSERLEIYQKVSRELIEKGHAYTCYCSPERLEAMRAEQTRRKLPPKYDGLCRDLTPAERAAKESEGIVPVVRFKTPTTGSTSVRDIIRGGVTWNNATLDDFILLKSDGFPTYHLAAVVDDHLMEISHVLRADEWLSSTPRHLLLYRALDYQPPLFAHLPLILGPDRSKLAKRHGAVSILEYRDQGYLPEAMVNFLALLGWALDDRTQVMDRSALIKGFSLERISKPGAIFSLDKLNWINGVYIRQLGEDDLRDRLVAYFEAHLPPEVPRPLDAGFVGRLVPLLQTRIKTLGEAVEMGSFFFTEKVDYDPVLLTQKDISRQTALQALQTGLARIEPLKNFSAAELEGVLRPLAAEMGLKTGELFGIYRVAVTGRTAAPPLFESMELVGRERCLARIEQAIDHLRGD